MTAIDPEGDNGGSNMEQENVRVRPGGTAYVSPEGIVHSTDGKYRWAYEVDRWMDGSQWVAGVGKYALIGAVLGVLTTFEVFVALTALGAVLHVWNILTEGRKRCVLFTMDEGMVSRQQVKGKADKEKVLHTVAAWVGGQSNPSLQFEQPVETVFSGVRRVVADRARGQFRLSGTSGKNRIDVEDAQFDFVLGQLKQVCPGKVQER